MPAKPKSAFPNPAVVLPGEADVLANVLVNLADHDAKLVYADWLEERDDPRGPLLRECVEAYRAGKKLPKVTAAPKPWRDLVGVTLMMQLRGTALASHTNQILALAQPALALKFAKAPDKALSVGASKIGGQPDLPPVTKWPTLAGASLAFIGQFDLAELRVSPVCRELPACGVLSVFATCDEEREYNDFPKGSWRVFHFPNVAELARREPPGGASLQPCRLEFTEQQTLPALDSPWAREFVRAISHDRLRETAEEAAYINLLIGLCLSSQLLGHPSSIEGDVLGKKKVRHLLTFYGNRRGGWRWQSIGSLYFTLGEESLKNHLFDRAKMTADSS